MTESEEMEFDIKDEHELTMYTYICDYRLCFEYFVGYEIASLVGYKNPKNTINKNVSICNKLLLRDFPGEKNPPLDPRTILINRDGASEILLKTRKKINPDVNHLFEKFGISITNKKCLSKEQSTVLEIENAFKSEKMEDQYSVGKYRLDLYFSEYKIVVECDENGHQDRKPWKERERMDFVNKKLSITDDSWVRYNPDDIQSYDITKVIGQIYRKISVLKSQPVSRVITEAGRKAILDSSHISRAKRNIELLPEKPCTYCNVTKLLQEFHNAKDHRDGKDNICKLCKKQKDTERVLKFREDTHLPDNKSCNVCNETKTLDDFYRDKNAPDGRMRRCKECHTEKQRVSVTQIIITEKSCTACKVTKPVSEFYKASRARDGYRIYCAECSRAKVNATYCKNKDRYLETKRLKRQES